MNRGPIGSGLDVELRPTVIAVGELRREQTDKVQRLVNVVYKYMSDKWWTLFKVPSGRFDRIVCPASSWTCQLR